MKTKDWKAIAEKQAEIIDHYRIQVRSHDVIEDAELLRKWEIKRIKLLSELSLLESQEVEGVDAETISNGLSNVITGIQCDIDFNEKLNIPLLLDELTVILDQFEEYAQQSSNVTDEDIEKYFSLEKSTSGFIASKEYNQMQQYKIEGALAMKYNLIKPE